jgi:hypothetical protein
MSLENSQPRKESMTSTRPAKVTRARLEGNREALQAMGRKGAERANQKRNEALAFKDLEKERLAREEQFRREQAGEDILPPDIHN